jgi:hypothetical protein
MKITWTGPGLLAATKLRARIAELDVAVMTGLTMASVKRSTDAEENDTLEFESTCGRKFVLFHDRDCCESVTIDDIAGDLEDLVGSPLILSEEVSSADMGYESSKEDGDESFTWTFYRFATAKGYVTVRWYGTSNGYYSESVSFREITKGSV